MRLFRVFVIVLSILSFSQARFNPSRFNFGADWDFVAANDGANKISSAAQAVDYVSIWLNDPEFNQYWHGDMLKFCKSNDKTPVFYAYIVAKTSGLGDADVGGRLDSDGGQWLRGNITTVLGRYENYARNTASLYGTSDPVIWLMEPDYYQYCNGYGNDISYQEASGFMNQMIESVKKHLPNAVFSLDISPWCRDITSYINSFDMSKFSFMYNSGGRNNADSDRIRYETDNNVTYSQVNNASGKCIIADCGYGTGGGSTGHNSAWDDINNIRGRMQNGVAAITQKSPNANWGGTINSLKSSLSGEATKCNFEFPAPKYTIDITTKGKGTVSKSPDASYYEEGSKVTLTAVPQSGYKFLSWSGDVSGTDESVSVTMDKNRNVTATFVDVNAKSKFILTVSSTGSGVVEVEPELSEYDSGSTVTVTARTVNGATFESWGGALTSANQQEILTITGNTNLTAAFSGDDISIENIVDNGNFSDGAAGWTFGAYETARAEGTVEEGRFNVSLQAPGSEDWHIQLMQEDITLKNGITYKLSFNAYSESETSILALVGMGEDPYTSYMRKTVNLTPTEQTFDFTFRMRNNPTSSDRLEFTAGKATAGWTIDNITLAENIELDPFTPVTVPRPDTGLKRAGNRQATMTVYDHSGRIVWRASGDHATIIRQLQTRRPGSYIIVLDSNGTKQVKKAVSIGR